MSNLKNLIKMEKKIVYKLAWSFHKTTGVEFEELVSEGVLAYYEAVAIWKEEKRCKLTSLAYRMIYNAMTDFTRIEMRYVRPEPEIFDFNNIVTDQTPWFELYEQFPMDVREITDVCLNNVEELAGLNGKQARKKVRYLLKDAGWKLSDIWDGIRHTKEILNKIPEKSIIY